MTKEANSIDRLIESTYDFGRIMRQQMIGSSAGGPNLLHLHSLVLISEREGITMKELAQALHISSPSATSLCNRLVRTGWVARRHDDTNRKLVRLKLTDTGTKILREKQERRRLILRKIFSALSRREQIALTKMHQKLKHAITALPSH